MDGRGRWLDCIFIEIERLWRSSKYDGVYLHKPNTGSEARRVIGQWDELDVFRASILIFSRALSY